MSAYIVDFGCMDRVVLAVHEVAISGFFDDVDYFEARSIALNLLEDGPQALGELLFAMNREAVLSAYPGDESFARVPPGWVFQRGKVPSLMQLMKSMQAFSYQCSEGNVPDKPLFQKMSLIEDALQRRVGYDVERAIRGGQPFLDPQKAREYDRASWG